MVIFMLINLLFIFSFSCLVYSWDQNFYFLFSSKNDHQIHQFDYENSLGLI